MNSWAAVGVPAVVVVNHCSGASPKTLLQTDPLATKFGAKCEREMGTKNWTHFEGKTLYRGKGMLLLVQLSTNCSIGCC